MHALRVLVGILIVVILLFVAGASWVNTLLNKSAVWEKVLGHIVADALEVDAAQIKVQVAGVDIRFPHRGRIKNVTVRVDAKRQRLKLTVASLRLQAYYVRRIGLDHVTLDLDGINVQYTDFAADNIDMALTVTGLLELAPQVKGKVNAQNLRYQDMIDARQVKADIDGNEHRVLIENIHAQVFGGQLMGKIVVDNQKNLSYIINIQLQELGAQELARVQKAIGDNLSGNISGNIVLKGDKDGVQQFESDLTMPPQSRIRASLLQFLIQYIPKNTYQRQALDATIAENGFIPVTKLRMHTTNANPHQISNVIYLESSEYNLNLNGTTLDINLDERFDKVLFRLKRLVP